MKTRVITSITALRQESQAWDALWEHSDSHSPLLRFCALEQYVMRFHPHDVFIALVVEDCELAQGNKLAAALPLVLRKKKMLPTIAALPNNEWLRCGDLMFDTRYDSEILSNHVVAGLRGLDAHLLNLDWIDVNRECWDRILASLHRQQLSFSARNKFTVGLTKLGFGIDDLEQMLSKNRRKQLNRNLRDLRQGGRLELRLFEACDWEMASQIVMEMEHASWKGREKTSLVSAGMVDLYRNVWQALAARGEFIAWVLFHNGKAIAFDFGPCAKQVYSSLKIGYLEQYQEYSPGHLLYYLIIQQMTIDHDIQWIDTIGELTQATSRWTTDSYSLKKVSLPTAKFGSDQLFTLEQAMRSIKSCLHRPAHSLQDRQLAPGLIPCATPSCTSTASR